jgi:flagellar hook-associated protein 3 FlgL
MRIASTQYHTTMSTALQRAQAQLEQTMEQMSTGARIQKPSDDPVTSVRLSRLTREDAATTQYRDNIAALKTRLSNNEALLDGMNTDMQEVRDLLVWAPNGSNTAEDVAAMASSLTTLRDSLLDTSNSKDQEGRYLFSGTASTTPTVSYNAAAPLGARYSYTGNGQTQQVVVGNGVTQAANVALPEVAPLLNQLDQMIATLGTAGVNVNDSAVQAQLAAGLGQLDATMGSVTARISKLGGAQNMLETLDTGHANVSLSNQQAALTLGQLDYNQGRAAQRLHHRGAGHAEGLRQGQRTVAFQRLVIGGARHTGRHADPFAGPFAGPDRRPGRHRHAAQQRHALDRDGSAHRGLRRGAGRAPCPARRGPLGRRLAAPGGRRPAEPGLPGRAGPQPG